jgi:hypothetical protein
MLPSTLRGTPGSLVAHFIFTNRIDIRLRTSPQAADPPNRDVPRLLAITSSLKQRQCAMGACKIFLTQSCSVNAGVNSGAASTRSYSKL